MVLARRALLLLLVAAGALRPVAAAADAGPWSWPLAGPHAVSRPFAPPATAYGAGHRGADLPAAPGALVRAAAAGRVSYAGLLAGRGVVVVVHGALRTTYEPVSALVAVGREVSGGEPLGVLEEGHAGCPAPACLHWGLRRGEAYLDPVRLVERGPVRLLPTDGAAGAGGGGWAGGGWAGGGGAGGSARSPSSAAGPGAGAPTGGAVPPPVEGPSGLSTGSARGAADPSGAADLGGAGDPSTAADAGSASAEWSVRGADVPLGTTAVVALVLGIGLLTRPRPGPEDPPAVSGASPAPVALEPAVPDGPVAPVLPLDAERLRRRTG